MRVFMLLSMLLCAAHAVAGVEVFGIQVVDGDSGRPVPLATLETVHGLRYVSDSAGMIAFDELGLLKRRVFFNVSAPGYTFPKDNFGYAGLALDTTPGTTSTIKLVRTSIAERLYRITGQGIYRDTLMLGKDAPLPHPNLNGGVLAQGDAQCALIDNKLLWIWSDTQRPAHPIGNTRGTAALSDLPKNGGLEPGVGIHFSYFTNDRDEPQGIFPGKEPGSVSFDGMVSVKDNSNAEHLLVHYVRSDADGKRQEQGIAEWNPQRHELERVLVISDDYQWQFPQGHAMRVTDEKSDMLYFCAPFAHVRVPATFEAVVTPSLYEALTHDDEKGEIIWQKTQKPMTREDEEKWIDKRWIKRADARLQLEDVENGKPLIAKAGAVRWSAWRKAFLMIFADEKGDVWYAESHHADGPWKDALRITTHNGKPFTGLSHHDAFDDKGGQVIYFEGTLKDEGAPRYNGNALMYRLDLSDERLGDAHVK